MTKERFFRNTLLICLYFLIMNMVFIQMPLSCSLTGNLDTWANLSMFKDMGNHISNLFCSQPLGSSNYPCTNIWALYGLDFFSGVLFLFFKLFHLSDLWAYHFYITTIYTLNSVSVYVLCRHFSASRTGCFLAGLFFSISNFVLANIDNPNIVFVSPGILSIYFLINAAEFRSEKRLFLSITLLCLQFLMAPVTCVMMSFIIIPYAIYNFPGLFALITIKANRILFIPIFIFAGVLAPYIYYYMVLKIPTTEFNVVRKMEIVPYLSMNLDDFFKPLPNNLIFSNKETQWTSIIKSGYTGAALLSVAILGLFQFRKVRFPVFIFLIGLIFSMGPYITMNEHTVCTSPVLLLYKILPVSDYLRIPSRFFILSILGLVILFSIGWQKLTQMNSLATKIMMVAIPFLYVVENVPFPMKKYPTYRIYCNGLRSQNIIKDSKFKVVLNLPSRLFESEDYREYLYMCYQTINKKNMINGSLAWTPLIRIRNDSMCKKAEDPIVLTKLIKDNGVDVVLFHTEIAEPQELRILKTIGKMPNMVPIDTIGPNKIFAVRDM